MRVAYAMELIEQTRRMSMRKRFKSVATAAIHEGVSDLYKVGAVAKITMREFDRACLTPVYEMTPRKIRALRVREAGTQDVFAALLNVSPNLIRRWESGEAKPRGASLKLLTLVEKKGLEIVV
jgi:putative transcriptional regulator